MHFRKHSRGDDQGTEIGVHYQRLNALPWNNGLQPHAAVISRSPQLTRIDWSANDDFEFILNGLISGRFQCVTFLLLHSRELLLNGVRNLLNDSILFCHCAAANAAAIKSFAYAGKYNMYSNEEEN